MSGINLSLFSQITSLLDRQAFGRIVKARDTDKHAKSINSWTHLVNMLFVHLA